MKLGEVVVLIEYYNITKFYQILMKNKKKLYVKHNGTVRPLRAGEFGLY